MRRKTLGIVGMTMLLAAGFAVAMIGFAASPARAGGSVCSDATHTCTWDGNGTDASSCQNVTAGTGILWIFTGRATPTDLVVTWSNGETDSITGWIQQGNGSWHLQTDLVGSFPPESAYVDFTGENGSSGATLTISGCNEGGPGGTTTTVTTPTTTTSTTTTTTTPTTTTGGTATIEIVKTADATEVDAGQSIGFTLTVFNPGTGDAQGVNLSDTLPTNSGLSWTVDTQGAGWGGSCGISSGVLSCGGSGGVTVPAGTTQAGSTFTVHITSPTTADTGGGCPGGSGMVNNTGDVTTANAGSGESSASTCVAGPAIEIVKTPDNAQVNAGQSIGFTLTVYNDGTGDAHDVKLTDTLPSKPGLTWSIAAQGAGWGGSCGIAGGVLTCGPATVPAGTTQAGSTFTVHVTSPTTGDTGGDCPGGSGVVDNTADVTTSNAGSGQSSASTCVQAVVDLAVTKTGSPATQDLGSGNITWTIVVTNNGPSTDTGVTVSDPMPAGNTYVSSSTTQGTCTGGAILTCDIGDMAAGASVTVTLVTTPSTTGTQTNTVTVSGERPDTDTSNNTASASVEVTKPLTPPKPCIAVSRVTPKQLFVGRKTTLKIRVTQGGKAVHGIRVRIKGAGINVRTHPSSHKGAIKQTVKLKKAGVLRFTAIASKPCNAKRVGVTGVFTPPVTG